MPSVLQAAPRASKSTCQAPLSLQGSTQALTRLCSLPHVSDPPYGSIESLQLFRVTGRTHLARCEQASCSPWSHGPAFSLPRGPCRQVQSWKPMTDQHLLTGIHTHTTLDSAHLTPLPSSGSLNEGPIFCPCLCRIMRAEVGEHTGYAQLSNLSSIHGTNTLPTVKPESSTICWFTVSPPGRTVPALGQELISAT